MLPFLKNRNEGSASVSEPVTRKADEEQDYDALESAAQDLSAAIHSKDIKGICVALRAAFDLLESEPHNEGPEAA